MKQAIDLIKHFESLHDGDLSVIGLQPKMCPAGIWTEGYGHAMVDPDKHTFLKGEEMKEEAYALQTIYHEKEAEAILNIDLSRYELSVKSLVKRNATDNELAAMLSLCYNIGIGSFKDSSVLRYFNQGDKETAAESFKLFVKCGKKVLKGLQRRRAAEAHLFLYNEVKFEA